jgi:tetratricopeptide (TPR) repeat protein
MLQFFAGDSTGAETSLRRALTLDPSREQAWDMLTSLTAEAKRYEDLVSLCEERLKRKDIARTRLLLAYTYEKLNRLDQAEEQVQAALKLEPEDFTANLALAVLLLKRSDDVAVLSRAGELLNKAGEIIRESPTPVQWMDYSTTGGIYLALRGSLEEARQQLKRVLEYDLHNEAAREALEALGG